MDAYVETPRQAQANDFAVQRLAYSCMKKLGLDWPEPRMVENRSPASVNSRRYGVIDISEVRRIGYHAPVSEGDQEHGADLNGKKFVPDAKEFEAYTGRRLDEPMEASDQMGGCRGDAERKVYGTDGLEPELVELLKYHARSFLDAGRDPRVLRAMASWKACMTGFGYSYEDIWDANDDPRWQSSSVSSKEKETAERDVNCKMKSRVPTVLLSVESDLQSAHMRSHPEEFSRIKDHFAQAYRRSSAVVGN
ncbi:hypothetical protein [Streptomyces sp. NPDC058326]|uniref:hypothetical protein n=1 Tax=Streptomyces sp. NPDC058326 TaxID=3346447 RepID=UPI0036DFD001